MAFLVRRTTRKDLWDPFRELGDLQREMNRLLSNLGSGLWRRGDGDEEGSWTMPLDIYETKDHFVVKADLPELKPEELDLSVLGNTLTIKAERKHEAEVEDERFYRRELAYGAFQRQIELPQAVKADALTAAYKNGVLEIRLRVCLPGGGAV